MSDISKILVSKEQLAAKVKELADCINNDYCGKELLVVSVLKGGVIFAADLLRELTIPVQIDFMAVSSYGSSSESSGVVRILKDLNEAVEGKHILIVEDIIDSGLTLKYLIELLKSRDPKSIKICTILNKPARRESNIRVDYIGFDIPDEFVVGYGLDYAEKYRNLPYIGVLKPEIYS